MEHDSSAWSQWPGWVISAVLALILSPAAVVAVWRRIKRNPPVYVHVETDAELVFANSPDWISFPQFVPRPVESLPPIPSGKAVKLAKWAEPIGGIPAQHTHLEVTITARDQCHVVVQRLRIKAVAAALTDGCVLVRSVGGAAMEFRRIDVRLSTKGSITQFTAPGGRATSPFEFQLAPGESAKFSLIVVADGSEDVDRYRWYGVLDLLHRGKAISIPIRDGDGMFSLVNSGRRPTYMTYGGDDASWEPWCSS